MKPGPRPSYISAGLILLVGAMTLWGGLMIIRSSVFADKAVIEGVSRERVWLYLISGSLAAAGAVMMILRKPAGFWMAGIGMLLLAAMRIYVLIQKPDSEFKRYLMAAVFLWVAIESLLIVWRYQRNPPGDDEPLRDLLRRHPATAPLADLYMRPSGESSASGPRPSPPAGNTLTHLDAGDFAPISEEEMRRRAKKVDRSLVFRFGLRSQIPPATDERTLLIDKALVAHGLLTPGRLVEIHETGEVYARLRPTLQNLGIAEQAAASRAVGELEAERASTREEKRAAAAARRALRAKAIEGRKATDIIFLGRSVSGGLADRRANVEKLAAFSLPVLTSPADIATALGLPIHRLRWLAFHSEASPVSHYVRFTVPKKSGGTRELAAPHHDTAAAQMWILVNILERVPVRESAHGFVKGRSIMSNAVPHVRRDAVVNVDLKDFFPTITFPRVRGIFEGLGYSPAAATVLALLCTESPRRTVEYDGKTLHVATGARALPQGACTSPALSNLAARKLDARLNGLARKTGWTYTRYADDLTFSASGETAKQCGGLLTALRRFCAEEGFTVNEKKTRVQRQNTQQTVTGIVVNRRPNVPRDLYRRLRAILHNARKTGLAAQNTENHPNFVMWVQGMIAWISMANPDRGRILRTAFDKLKSVT
ncbi:MAG TPA: reverse transcriptase family protein [Verrucomicrobiales bacterium]|nr:reverse transcriptase family protein [Verrucomicrobiales bacterium]